MAGINNFNGKLYTVNFQGKLAKFGWEYDHKRKIGVLFVEFSNGEQYEYFDVSKLLWASFWDAPSKGKWFQSEIKNAPSINYEKVTE